MASLNPQASKLIDEYIASLEPFSFEICTILRELIYKSDIEIMEDWKWNIPVFQKKEMVFGFAAFKKHVSLTFFKGNLLADPYQLFSDDCTAKNMRTIKFTDHSEINKNQLLEYFNETFLISNNSKSPNAISQKTLIQIPESLQNALDKNKLAKENFENMAYTYRKEYAIHISDAKREATQLKRLEKVIQNLEQNIKMHEQYKC